MSNNRIRGNQIKDPRTIRQNEHEDNADARRTVLVDENGNLINQDNPLHTDAVINLNSTKPGTPTRLATLVTTANTEYSLTLPAKTEIFTISVKSSKAIVLQYSYQAGQSASNFFTVRPGVTSKTEGIYLDTPTQIYFQLNRVELGGTTVEIETWS